MTAGDQARVSALVRVPPAEAFRIFTEEIDQWWRSGPAFRIGPGAITLEAEPGGRLLERNGAQQRVFGRVLRWEPPELLLLEWRGANFAPDEKTEVEVRFDPSASGTLVTITHRGWASIRGDHPARHGQRTRVFLRSMGSWWGQLATSLREHAER